MVFFIYICVFYSFFRFRRIVFRIRVNCDVIGEYDGEEGIGVIFKVIGGGKVFVKWRRVGGFLSF